MPCLSIMLVIMLCALSLSLSHTHTAAQGLAQLTQNDDEVFSGTPSSPPTSVIGPLSPAPTGIKAITPLKSTSQVLLIHNLQCLTNSWMLSVCSRNVLNFNL